MLQSESAANGEIALWVSRTISMFDIRVIGITGISVFIIPTQANGPIISKDVGVQSFGSCLAGITFWGVFSSKPSGFSGSSPFIGSSPIVVTDLEV